MSTCASCGKAMTDEMKFCPACGAEVGGAPKPIGMSGLSPGAVSFFTYFFPVAGPVLFLNLAPYNATENVRFHAWQSLFLDAAWMGLSVAIAVVAMPMALLHIPLAGVLPAIVHYAFVGVWVYTLFKSLSAEAFELPVIADYARKQARGEGFKF